MFGACSSEIEKLVLPTEIKPDPVEKQVPRSRLSCQDASGKTARRNNDASKDARGRPQVEASDKLSEKKSYDEHRDAYQMKASRRGSKRSSGNREWWTSNQISRREPPDHNIYTRLRRLKTIPREFESGLRNQQLAPPIDPAAKQIHLFARFGSAFMNMRMLACTTKTPIPALDASGTNVRRVLAAACNNQKKKKPSDEKAGHMLGGDPKMKVKRHRT